MEPGIPKRITPGALAVRRAGDRYKKRIAGVVLEALRRGQQEVDVKALAKGFEERSQARIEMATNVALARADEILRAKVPDLIFTTMAKGGEAELANGFNRSGKPFRAAKQVMAFDYQFPQAISWAQTKSGAMIVGISNETRAAIRELVGRAWQEGWPPNHAAQMIRSQVGLHPQYARAVENLRTRMINSPGKTIKAGKTRISIPKSGASQALIEKRCSQYASRLLNKRAVLIARTETVAAANAGQRMSWLQAQEKGLLGKEEKREWLTTPEPCPQCGPLNGEVTSMDKPFPSGYWEPPAHPGCKCSQSISKRMTIGKKVKVPPKVDKAIKPFGKEPLFNVSRMPHSSRQASILHDEEAALHVKRQFKGVSAEFKKRGYNISLPVELDHLTPAGRAKIQIIRNNLDGMAQAHNIMLERGTLSSRKGVNIRWYSEEGGQVAARGGFGSVQWNFNCVELQMAYSQPGSLHISAEVFLHEYGHVAHNEVRNRIAKLAWDSRLLGSDRMWKKVATELGENWRTLKKVAGKVSRYATTDPLEFVAETFSGVHSGKKYSSEVMRMYKNMGGPPLEAAKKVVKEVDKIVSVVTPKTKPIPTSSSGVRPIPPESKVWIEKIIELRKGGMSHAQIAQEMGWRYKGGSKRVWNILKRYAGMD